MINNDTKPPTNNYTEEERGSEIFKVATGRLAKVWLVDLANRQDRSISGINCSKTQLNELVYCTCSKVSSVCDHFG